MSDAGARNAALAIDSLVNSMSRILNVVAIPEMRFELGDDVEMLRAFVRSWVQTEPAPRAAEIDRNDQFPMDAPKQMGDLGVLWITVAEEYGGANMDVGAVVSETGKLLGTLSVTAESAGYLKLLIWANSLVHLRRAGVEGTGTYGAGLARALRDHEAKVLEVNRPDRAAHRSRGESADRCGNAARAVLAGKATAIPKEPSGSAEAMRAVFGARRSAVKTKTQTINLLRALLVSAPQDIRERLLKAKTFVLPSDVEGPSIASTRLESGTPPRDSAVAWRSTGSACRIPSAFRPRTPKGVR